MKGPNYPWFACAGPSIRFWFSWSTSPLAPLSLNVIDTLKAQEPLFDNDDLVMTSNRLGEGGFTCAVSSMGSILDKLRTGRTITQEERALRSRTIG